MCKLWVRAPSLPQPPPSTTRLPIYRISEEEVVVLVMLGWVGLVRIAGVRKDLI